MGRELFGIFLRKGFVDLQRLLIFLPGLFRPVLCAIQNPQIVERRRYVRQIGLRLFLRQLTVDLQRLLIFVPGLLHPVLVAIKNPKVIERRRYVRQIGLRLFLRQLTVDLQRLLGFRSGLPQPVLGTIKKSQVVEHHRYVRQIGLRLFLRQLTVDLQRLLGFRSGLPHPVLAAIKQPQVIERYRYERQIGLRLFLRQRTGGLQRLVQPVRGALNDPQVVKRHRYERQIGLRLFLCQFAVNPERLLKFLPSRLHPLRRAIENPRVVEPVRGSAIFPRWFSRGLPSESAQIVRGTWICCRRLVNDCDFYNGRTSRLVRDHYIRQARRIDPQTCERQQNYATEAPEHRSDDPRGLSDSSSSFFTRVTVRENCAESCCAKLRPAQA